MKLDEITRKHLPFHLDTIILSWKLAFKLRLTRLPEAKKGASEVLQIQATETQYG